MSVNTGKKRIQVYIYIYFFEKCAGAQILFRLKPNIPLERSRVFTNIQNKTLFWNFHVGEVRTPLDFTTDLSGSAAGVGEHYFDIYFWIIRSATILTITIIDLSTRIFSYRSWATSCFSRLWGTQYIRKWQWCILAQALKPE